MLRIPKKVSERLQKEATRFQKILLDAKKRDVNESDTVTIITDMLSAVFGYDKYTEITTEQAIRGTYCDLAVTTEGKIKFLIEVKAIGLELKDNHLRQAVNYGANEGIQWIVLTNGADWRVYRLRFERPIDYDLTCSFDFTSFNPRRQDDQTKLFLLCKEGINKEAIEAFHEHIQSVNKYVIGAVIFSDPVKNVIRRELRRLSPGVKIDIEDIEKVLKSEVLKRDVLEGEEADKAQDRLKKGARTKIRKVRRRKGANDSNSVKSDHTMHERTGLSSESET